jgi:hypothetical protein
MGFMNEFSRKNQILSNTWNDTKKVPDAGASGVGNTNEQASRGHADLIGNFLILLV